MNFKEREQIEEFLEKVEAGPEDSLPDEERDMMLEAVKDSYKARTEMLAKLHESLMFIIHMPPTDFTKYIVRDMKEPHSFQKKTMEKIKEFEVDDDLLERMEKATIALDKKRILGLRRLQAFVKIRPQLMAAMKELGLDISKYPS